MLVDLARLEVTAHRDHLDEMLSVLQELRVAEVVRVQPPGGARRDSAPEPDDISDRLSALLALVPAVTSAPAVASSEVAQAPQVQPVATEGASAPADATDEIQALLADLEARTTAVLEHIEALRSEAETLPQHITLLESLQPLVPELGQLDDRELAHLGLASIAVVLEDPQGTVVEVLRQALTERLGPTHLLVTSPTDEDGRVSCMLVLRRHRLAEVRALLGEELIGEVGVPEAYAGRSLRSTVAAMHERLAALPAARQAADQELAHLLDPVVTRLRDLKWEVAAQRERTSAALAATTSERTFTLALWVPVDEVDALVRRLDADLVSRVEIRQVPGSSALARDGSPPAAGADIEPPMLLRNRKSWRPYQELVGLLSWPAPRTLDPTGLMALVMPMLFGMMVGDVGYGLGLLGIAWLIRRRVSMEIAQQAASVLAMCALWAIGLGLLFGEFLGSIGHHLGMPALWFYRGGPANLTTLLLLSVGVGGAHVSIALILGVWTAYRRHQRALVGERIGNLLILAGLFAIAAVAAGALPRGALTPAAAGIIVGLIVASVSQGLLGLLLGPLAAIGVIGNVLSYLRLAAVGLASVYLASVANELAGQGPLLLGIVVAAFFHALNLALAAFSPMVQSLRLHYVEFFGQFHDGGGHLFTPLGSDLPSAPLPSTPSS